MTAVPVPSAVLRATAAATAEDCGDFDCVDASNYEPGCPQHDPYPDGYPDPGPSFWFGRDGSWGCEQCPERGQAGSELAAANEALRHEKAMHP